MRGISKSITESLYDSILKETVSITAGTTYITSDETGVSIEDNGNSIRVAGNNVSVDVESEIAPMEDVIDDELPEEPIADLPSEDEPPMEDELPMEDTEVEDVVTEEVLVKDDEETKEEINNSKIEEADGFNHAQNIEIYKNPEFDYKITDITELDNVGDGDVRAIDMYSILNDLNESLSVKFGTDNWGVINPFVTRCGKDHKTNESYGSAILDIGIPMTESSPALNTVLSIELSGNGMLKECIVRDARLHKRIERYSGKTFSPVAHLESVICDLINGREKTLNYVISEDIEVLRNEPKVDDKKVVATDRAVDTRIDKNTEREEERASKFVKRFKVTKNFDIEKEPNQKYKVEKELTEDSFKSARTRKIEESANPEDLPKDIQELQNFIKEDNWNVYINVRPEDVYDMEIENWDSSGGNFIVYVQGADAKELAKDLWTYADNYNVDEEVSFELEGARKYGLTTRQLVEAIEERQEMIAELATKVYEKFVSPREEIGKMVESFDANVENTMDEVRKAVEENPNQGSILVRSYPLGDKRVADLRYYPTTKSAEFEFYTNEGTDEEEHWVADEFLDTLEDFSLDMTDEELDQVARKFLGLTEGVKLNEAKGLLDDEPEVEGESLEDIPEDSLVDDTLDENNTEVAIFHRKPQSVEAMKAAEANGITVNKSNYKVVGTKELSSEEFNNFANHLNSESNTWLKEFSDMQEESGMFTCVEVKNKDDKNSYSILVDPQGYDYARYAAIKEPVLDAEELIEPNAEELIEPNAEELEIPEEEQE